MTYVAANSEEGVRLLEQHKDEVGLIILDINMPGFWPGARDRMRIIKGEET